MADKFQGRVEFSAVDEDGAWSVTEHVVAYIAEQLGALGGHLQGPEFSLKDVDGSSISRDSLGGLREAARANHLTPDMVRSSFLARRGVNSPGKGKDDLEQLRFQLELTLYADLEVDVWTRFAGKMRGRPTVQVHLKSPDKLLLDGFKARLVAENELIEREGPRPPGVTVAPAPAPTTPVISAIPAQQRQSAVAPAEQVTPESFGGWVKRTWRDHTAAFIFTTAGTVVGGAVLIWLGLSL